MISGFLHAVFLENKLLEQTWERLPLESSFTTGKSYEYVVLAIEHFVLMELSKHLNEYFNGEEKEIDVLTRENIQTIRIINPIMHILTRDITDFKTDRDKLIQGMGKAEDIIEEIQNELVFDQFRLRLPKGSRISKKDVLSPVIVSTNKLDITIEAYLKGQDMIVPVLFRDHYLSEENSGDIVFYTAGVKIRINFKWRIFFGGLQYYSWVDSFLEKLDRSVSKGIFFDNIGWEVALTTVAFYLSRMQGSNRSRTSSNLQHSEPAASMKQQPIDPPKDG